MVQRDDTFDARAAVVREKLARVEAVLGKRLFFAGPAFSIVDAVFARVFRYVDALPALDAVGGFDRTPKVAAWRHALAARPSVEGAVVPDYPDRLRASVTGQAGVLADRAAG